ncbi:hypothetical protein PO909_006758 [Leuciscus waleckii]
MTIAVLRSRLALVPEGGVPITTPHPRVPCGMGDQRIIVMASPPLTPLSHRSRWSPSIMDRPAVSFGAPPEDRMAIAASEGELASADDDSAALSPSGSVTLPEPDPEMSAMLKRAAEAVGLAWNPPPYPEQSRLDDWFLGAGRAGSQSAAPVPFFPELHGELTRSWTAPFSARNCLSSSSPLTTPDGGAVKSRHTCVRRTAASWTGDPHLPSKAYEEEEDEDEDKEEDEEVEEEDEDKEEEDEVEEEGKEG